MASISNDERVALGVMSGHGRNTLRLSVQESIHRAMQVHAASFRVHQVSADLGRLRAATHHFCMPVTATGRRPYLLQGRNPAGVPARHTSSMTVAAELQGAAARQDGRPRGAAADPASRPAVSAELVSRFHALIEEVTDELMQGQGQDLDRQTCRADAITILVATSEQLDGSAEGGESPLMYLLLEEQQKTAAILGLATATGHAPVFIKV
jgi:hypothetical protein